MDGGDHDVDESSSKRRERLLALRSAASASPAAADPSPPPGLLPDPDLAGDSSPGPRPPQRFGYYTNPAAAYCSNSSYSGGATNPNSHKRKSPPASYPPSPAPPPPAYGNYGSNYPPHQKHFASPPIHSPSPMPRHSPVSSPWRSPMQFQDTVPGYQGAPPGAGPPWGPHSGPPARGYYANSPSFGFRHPNPGRGGSPMNYGPRGSPHSSYGRGYGSPGSRGRGGRGFGGGFQNPRWQDRDYLNKSMVDDPWLDMQPVVGNILIPKGDSESWLPESLRAKKEPPAQVQIKPTPGLSLAEYLDLSFNEVSNSET